MSAPHETDEIGARIRATSLSVSAPLTLQTRVQPRARTRREPSRKGLALMGAVLAIAATVTAVLAPDPPTVQRVAGVALAAPTDPAPDGADYLPGYDAVGARTDSIAGRSARTVIYRRGATGIHYTIVDGRPLDLPGTRTATVGDLELALASDGEVELVAWHRDGKTCILASRTATADEMVELLRRA